MEVWMYRGIAAGNRVWNGNPNGGAVQAPAEEGHYDLFEVADSDNCHVGYKWEKSNFVKPEVSYMGSWYPVPDTYWR